MCYVTQAYQTCKSIGKNGAPEETYMPYLKGVIYWLKAHVP